MIPASAPAQTRRKVPIVGKTSGGPVHQAFSGKVQSLDLKHGVLNMTVPQGEGMEIFPVKKHVPVADPDGAKLGLKALKPGTSIIIYYEQKGAEREVKQIVVLSSGAGEAKKKSPPPS